MKNRTLDTSFSRFPAPSMWFAAGAVGILSASACMAQGTTGSITGTVTDPAGAVVPGASITVTQ
ncbi:MAG: carboxypeptidase-like regulatory domain-containing protein, partial [Janthinobacterium lividum]